MLKPLLLFPLKSWTEFSRHKTLTDLFLKSLQDFLFCRICKTSKFIPGTLFITIHLQHSLLQYICNYRGLSLTNWTVTLFFLFAVNCLETISTVPFLRNGELCHLWTCMYIYALSLFRHTLLCVWICRLICWMMRMQFSTWKPDKWFNPKRDWKHYNPY